MSVGCVVFVYTATAFTALSAPSTVTNAASTEPAAGLTSSLSVIVSVAFVGVPAMRPNGPTRLNSDSATVRDALVTSLSMTGTANVRLETPSAKFSVLFVPR